MKMDFKIRHFFFFFQITGLPMSKYNFHKLKNTNLIKYRESMSQKFI